MATVQPRDAATPIESPVAWVYTATLSLRTPLRVLKKHGERINIEGADMAVERRPSMKGFDGVYGEWVLFNGTEVQEHDGEHMYHAGIAVSCDMLSHATTGERYFRFLRDFRGIVETQGELPSKKRQRLSEWFNHGVYPDVVYSHGGESEILDKVCPFFMDYLVQNNIPLEQCRRLRTAGADSPWLLGKMTRNDLASHGLFPGACLALEILWQEYREAVNKCESAFEQQVLQDNYIQILF